MKLPWKKLPVVAIAVFGLTACQQGAPISPSSTAGSGGGSTAVRGNGTPDGAKLVFNFNLIGVPRDYDGGCGEGRRIFVERDDNHADIIIHDHDDGWHIEDCDAAGPGDTAEIHSDELGQYDVYVRLLGSPNGELTICADLISDFESDGHLCTIDEINLKREGGQAKFTVLPDDIFDAELEDIIWKTENSSGFKIAQFRVYKTGQ